MATHTVWVTSESADLVTRLRFDGRTLVVEEERPVGSFASELDAPHGVALSPDGASVYVTLGHGRPFGWLWKVDAEGQLPVERVMLGHFPASIDVTPDGTHAFVANFNLHGDHRASSVSRVHLPTMTETARTETCVMPHGSRVNAQGTRHYSVCMMDDRLVEIDVATGRVSRMFSVAPGQEGPVPSGAGERRGRAASACAPTWVAVAPGDERVYVACSRAATVLEIDVREWRVVRRLATGAGSYNVEVTPDGRWLLVTLRVRDAAALEMIDLSSGAAAATIHTSAPLAHGIAVSADSRFAFVSAEGVGAQPGYVDVIDLQARRRVAAAEVGQQATGIAVVR